MATRTIPLGKMSVGQKLGAIERIWDSLVQTSDAVASPAWHLELLESRKHSVAQGKSQFTSWEVAKEEIHREVRS